MRSLLHQLENNEAILLMYLADELPPHDRADVDQMLATDAGLRAELVRLTESTRDIDAALAHLDAHERLPMNADAAARRVGRLAAEWHVRRLAAKAAEAPAMPAGRRWRYPVAAAAACAMISLAVWWASSPTSVRRPIVEAQNSATNPTIGTSPIIDIDSTAQYAERVEFLLPVDATGDAVATTTPSVSAAAWTDRLDALEADLYALSADANAPGAFFVPAEQDSDGL